MNEREVADRHEVEWALRLFGDDVLETESLLMRFGAVSVDDQPRAPAGTATGGRWVKPGGGAAKKAPAKKAQPRKKAQPKPKLSKEQRVQALVKGVLKALDSLMSDLTAPQAQALIKRVKANAEALVAGQAKGGHHHGGGKKAAPGGAAKKAAPGGGGAATKKGTAPSKHTVAGLIKGLKGLLSVFGHSMKKANKARLTRLVSGLEKAAADGDEIEALLTQFAPVSNTDEPSPMSRTVCIMALPDDDADVHDVGPEEKHATLLYFGDVDAHDDPQAMEDGKVALMGAVAKAAETTAPFDADVTGVEPLGDEGAQVWMLDSPDLQRLFEEIPQASPQVQDLYDGADATRYPEYRPHVTVGYVDNPQHDFDGEEAATPGDLSAAQDVQSIPFDKISLWWGDERHDFPLSGGLGAAEAG